MDLNSSTIVDGQYDASSSARGHWFPAMPTWPVVLLAFALAVTAYSTSRSSSNKLKHIPVLGTDMSASARKGEFRYNAKAFLERGYWEFNKIGKAFQIQTTEGAMIVLNARQSEEVGSKPDHIVDNMRPNGRALMDKYTQYLDGDSVVFRIIKTQLSTRLGELGDILAAQTTQCLIKELPACQDWTEVSIYKNIVRIVATVSTRISIGEELTTNEEWLQATIDYTVELVTCATILKHIPAALRPAVYRFVPAYQRLRKINRTAIRLVKQVVEARREAMRKPDFEQREDMLQWMLNERVKKQLGDEDYEKMAQFQLQVAFAAIHTTSMALTNMIFDLIAWPENIQLLRAEVAEQLARNENSYRGQFVKSLPKLDSFMKESQRHNPVGYTIMGRDICQDLTLSDGLFLPKGTFVVANGYQITHDPDILQSSSDPDAFDGLRYYNMRDKMMKNGVEEKEVAGKHQFVSISNSSLMFGYGKHACPGRFFAGNEIKLLLAKLLIHFDFKAPREGEGRYKSKSWEVANYPDPDKTVMMRSLGPIDV